MTDRRWFGTSPMVRIYDLWLRLRHNPAAFKRQVRLLFPQLFEAKDGKVSGT